MSTAMKAVSLNNGHATSIYLRAALFHSTPISDRKRRTHWDSGRGAFRNSSKNFNNYSKRFGKMHAKQTLLRNVSAYAESLFQDWQDDNDEDFNDPSSSGRTSWFKRKYWARGMRRNGSGSQGPQWETYKNRGKGGFQFCYVDDEGVETIFRSAFGGERCSYWSFINDDYSHWRSSSSYSRNSKSSWNWRYRCEDDYETYEEYNNSIESDLASDRIALGLSPFGPLKLDEVKSAYRACALKWHPDRHQGCSKAVAEERFKLCSAAYQSLCDKID